MIQSQILDLSERTGIESVVELEDVSIGKAARPATALLLHSVRPQCLANVKRV